MSYLRIVLDGLEEPTNSLEQEAYDLVSKRIADLKKGEDEDLKISFSLEEHFILYFSTFKI